MRRYLVFVVFALASVSFAGGVDPVCESPKMIQTFVQSTWDTYDHTAAIFDPFMPELLQCLKRWVEDGGEGDELPAGTWTPKGITPRLFYRMEALSTIQSLHREYTVVHPNPAYAVETRKLLSWTSSSLKAWPDELRSLAYRVLARADYQEALPIIKEGARSEGGNCRTASWQALIMLNPESVTEMERMAQTEEQLRSLSLAIDYSDKRDKAVWEVRDRVRAKLRELDISKREKH